MSPSTAGTRCGHDGCTCSVEPGQSYCSDYCRAAASSDTTHQGGGSCGCGHAACAGNETVNGAR